MNNIQYFAGLFDGEGTILIRNQKGYFGLSLRIGMTHQLTVETILNYFKVGHIGHAYRNKKHPECKDLYTWEVCGNQAVGVLKKLFPYLVTKKAEAKVALEFAKLPKMSKGGRSLGLPQAMLDERIKYQNLLRSLR